ncbi:GTP-binding protein TypA/BipA-like [Durusdinium trenchii]|uniref:GTP-binding protein TypA/BipA-like n=1 Tax=Durusdinium trenchii TaxID=1381693 RepID=A0ABP0PVD4_9DINO
MPVDWSRLLDDEKKTLEGESVDCPCPHPLNSSGGAALGALLRMAGEDEGQREGERPVVRREGKGHPRSGAPQADRSDLAQKSLLVTAEGETEMEAQQMAPPPNERAAMIEETEFDESEDVASAPEDERDAPPVEEPVFARWERKAMETHPRPEPLMGEADWPEPEPSEEKPGAISKSHFNPRRRQRNEDDLLELGGKATVIASQSGQYMDPKSLVLMDAKSLYDSLNAEQAHGDDERSALEVAIIKESLAVTSGRPRWLPHNHNPADALTKIASHSEPLLKLLQTNHFSIEEETTVLERGRQHEDRRKSTLAKAARPDGTDSPVQSQDGEPLTEEEATSAQPSAATQQPEDDSKDEDPPAEDIPDPTNETEEEDFAKLFNFIDAEAASLALENAGPERFSQEALQAVLAEEVEGEEEESFEESSASDEKDEKDEKDSEDEKEDSGGEEEEEHAEAEVPESLEEDVVVATECKLEKEWCEAFSKAGFSAADIAQLTHKDGEWFYKGKSTKVGMAPPCDPHKDICAGGKEGFGNPVQQAAALKEAIQNGGIHPEMAHPCKLGEYWCPLMKKTGLSAPDIQKVTVANAEWQYDGEPLRVGYGQHSKACPAAQVYCAGGAVFGTGQSQANAVRDAIQNGGIHPAKANYKAFQNVCVLDGEKAATKDAGHAWKNLVECEQLCDMKAGCTGFEWYAKGLNLKTCFLFVNQALAGASTGQRVQDAECFIKKERRCIQFPNWRKKWLGSHVTISLGKHRFGANVGSWSTCLDLCESQKECKQVVFFRGRCFGMLARSDEDQSGKGGKNKGFISAHCYDKDVLHWVSNCNECGKQLCGHYARNENHLEGSFMMGSPLSTWGCSNLYTKPFTTVRSSSKRVYVVENEAEQASACPFLTPHSRPHQVLCEDGVYVKDYGCMKNGHGQRAKCPPNLPMMCAQQTCGPDKKDYCCKSSCKDFGGPRECSQAVTYYKNNMALSWSKFKEKCESRGKRLCTFTEVCHKQGLRPIGGLQSKSDAWCPIVEDDFQSPNYVEVGAVNVHPTCKKMTDDKASSSWTWPMADERRDLKEVYACCEGWSPRGIRWRNRPLTWRFQSPKDALTAHFGRRWACGEVSYQQLPKYLASAFPMKGTRDVNTADRNELVLPLPTLVFLLRSDRWRKVGLEGWTDTGNVGSYLGKVYPNQIRIYWKILEAGKHIIDNNSGMYLFTDPKRLAGCLGTAGATANPVGFMAPESFPQQPPRSAEELWAYNRQGAYGKKVQGMKFAAITLKENAENGGRERAWMKTAWANCLAKDADVTHVSVWVDAGYRCYKTLDCRPNGAGNVQTFSGAALGKAFVHLRSQGGAVGKSYLGTNVHGTVTFLAPQERMGLRRLSRDDQSGLQRWVLRKGEWYTIRVWEGTKGRFFLSSSGSKAILVASDDGSGLQRWSITKRPGGYFNIQDSSAKKFLSWSASGAIELSDADAHTERGCRDDGSGRQRWLIGFEVLEMKTEVLVTDPVIPFGWVYRRVVEGCPQADAAVLTAWAEKNFAKYGNTNLPANRVVTTRLSSGLVRMKSSELSRRSNGGDVVTLKGFTHTRDYARGFLRNAPGTATATVIGLEPGALYVWRVYQSARLVAGVNAMKVNNIFEAEQIVSSNTFTPRKRGSGLGVKWCRCRAKCFADSPDLADPKGAIVSQHRKDPSRSLHVQLSGLAVKRYDEAVDEHLSTWEETPGGWRPALTCGRLASGLRNNFNNRGQSNLQWTATYTYYLHNGYRCDLSGWTHTRTTAALLSEWEWQSLLQACRATPSKIRTPKAWCYAMSLRW